jgi:hypothetical protein
MKLKAAMAALALMVVAKVATAGVPAPEVDGFKAYELPAYTIVTHDEGNARQVPRVAAQIDVVLAKLLNRSALLPSAPTYISFVPDRTWMRYLEPGPGITGEFIPARFANYLVLSNARDETQVSTGIFHEYTHWFLHTQFAGVQPLWFDEGLAKFIETTEFRGSEVSLGEPGVIRPMGWVPMGQLLRMDKKSPEYWRRDTVQVVHHESWAMVHLGFVGDPAKFGKQMFAYLNAVNAQQPLDAAVQGSFGMTVDELGNLVHSYVMKSSQYLISSGYKVLRLPVNPAPNVRLPAGRAMGELESLEFIADIMLASGFHEDRLQEVADAMQRVAPNTASPATLTMRIAARAGDDAKLEQLLASVAPAAGGQKFLRGAGLALFERSGNSVREDFSIKALELLDRAIMSRPDDVEAIWAYTVLSASLKRDMPIALRRIANARAILPSNPDLAQATALLGKAMGDNVLTRKALTDTLRYAKKADMALWAKKRLESTTQ